MGVRKQQPRWDGLLLGLGAVSGRPGSDAANILAELGLQEELPKLEKAWVLQVSDLPSAW